MTKEVYPTKHPKEATDIVNPVYNYFIVEFKVPIPSSQDQKEVAKVMN
jgi:hypothetical protein